MKDFFKKVLKYIIFAAILYVVAVIAFTYFKEDRVAFSFEQAKNNMVFIVLFFGMAGLLLHDLLKLLDGKGKKKTKKAKDTVKDTKGNETQQFFDRDFVTEETLKSNKDFNYHTLSTIRSSKKDGILVRAEEKGHNMEINFVQPIHALCVGTTSSGKTSRFIIPSIQLMSMTAAKPSFVITDPKGELYEKCGSKLIKEGYDVKVVDLRDPFSSAQWNPLTYPYDLYHRCYSLEKEVKVHPPGDNPKNHKVIIAQSFNYAEQNWFEFNGHAYADKTSVEKAMRVVATQLRDQAYNALNDICTTLAPIESDKDPSWERTAQRLIHAVMLAMLEDSRIPELGMTREKYNLYNVYKICNTTDTGRETFATLKKYLFQYRDKFSKVGDLASTALNNAETTSKNYMGFVSSKTALFSDSGISYLTSRSEIDFVNLDEKPTAIFLIIPDEMRTRYPLAILFVTQLYKRLVEKAQSLGERLKRNVYFLLDEFGNMPRFPEFGSIMTVGRSRGIFFELCVQSYSQLYQVYGQDEGKIIKDNCPIQIYVASEDTTTNKEFSELLGKKTIVQTNENKSKGPDGKETTSTSEQILSIPIAYPEQLPTFRDEGKLVIKTFTPNSALKTVITSCYTSKTNGYDLTPMRGVYRPSGLLDEQAVFYDIKERNKFMSKDEEDDDDDLF
ncbi:MAG: type IV secretory system conjugative DNA transfer family protein [Clostridia bacterium]|nr:type IV secretory system conjugative DNA transfer family protein [Clostridia bacterium]